MLALHIAYSLAEADRQLVVCQNIETEKHATRSRNQKEWREVEYYW